ncbi:MULTISPECIES: CaiB/BaiF CoA transferase family protein [unclassified Aureimonas]|uniref:CaiB/BaiF CoA transferase family protein n=1 Tax=unclassified Aureimonas TaxID=2615206 RepID=UPI0006FD7A4D|nr:MULTISPECIES: CaiB/BaiF CoA-transferase family protein [unclassified Aureimonas]KQT60648.1 CoA-transferase [Aureimonas sp. Leaf460]KQT68777.1 CoA-transferase [Aureimonas sp. Leaf427]
MAQANAEPAEGALSGLRVLDMSRILAGPWAGQTLGDLGADVVKIERPGAGDDTRGWGPPFLKDRDGAETDVAAYFLCANRNKRSVTLDIATPEGQRIVRALAAKADILLENYKVGGLAQYGLDYDSLRQVNPRLIYCSITGFGQDGPYAARAGYDFLIQAMGGLMSITGGREGEPGAGPQKVGVAITDVVTGLYATIGILAALNARERTGEGQHVDIALLDAQIASLANQATNFFASGVSPQRLGNAHPNIVPYQDFPTRDGAMILAVGNDAQFARAASVFGHAGWAEDPRFATNRARVAHRADLVPMIAKATRLRYTSDWIAALEAVGVPCGPVNAIADVFEDPHVKARGVRVEVPHETAGSVSLVASPVRLSRTPVSYRSAPPALGGQTAEVLADWLDLDAAAVEALRAAGTV